MGTISRSSKPGGGTNINDGQIAVAADVNTDMNTVFTEVNGLLDDTNLETGTIPGAKSLRFTEISAPSTPASNDILVYANDDGGGVTRLYTVDAAGLHRVVTWPELVYDNIATVGTGANTTPTTLQSYTLPAGLLAVFRDTVRVTAWGRFAANGNTKTIQLNFGGTTLVGSSGAYNNLDWMMHGEISRASATIQVGESYVLISQTTPGVGRTSPTETLANSIQIALVGTNGTASANDILAISLRIEFWPYQPRS